MTLNPYAQIVLDASALAVSDLDHALQVKTLRTAVHVGVRWIFCPTGAAQSLAGRALYDLQDWRAIAPLSPDSGKAELVAASVRLRKSRIDLVSIQTIQCAATRIASAAMRDGGVGGIAIDVGDAGALVMALRVPGVSCVRFTDAFDATGWRSPSIPATLAARRGVEVFASEHRANVQGLTGVISAPDSPRALFRLLRDHCPRRPTSPRGISEAA